MATIADLPNKKRLVVDQESKPIAQSIGETAGDAARSIGETSSLAARNLGSVAQDINMLPGNIAAPVANTAARLGAQFMTGFTGQQYVPNQYQAEPVFGSGDLPTAKNRPMRGTSGSWDDGKAQATTAPATGIADGVQSAPDYANAQVVKLKPGFLGGSGIAGAPARVRAPAAAKTQQAPQVQTANAETAPQADYYDGKWAYQQRMAQEKGFDKAYIGDITNPDVIAFNKSIEAGYQGSPEQQKMAALGAQKGAANNPNDMSTWSPVQVVSGDTIGTMKPDARTGVYLDENAIAQRDAYDTASRKNIGDPLTNLEAKALGYDASRLADTGLRNQGDIAQQLVANKGAATVAGVHESGENYRTKADRQNKQLRADIDQGLASNDPVRQAWAMQARDRMNAANPSDDFMAVPGGETPDGVKLPGRVFNKRTQQYVSESPGMTPTPIDEYRAMKPGSGYIGPDGKRYIKGQ